MPGPKPGHGRADSVPIPPLARLALTAESHRCGGMHMMAERWSAEFGTTVPAAYRALQRWHNTATYITMNNLERLELFLNTEFPADATEDEARAAAWVTVTRRVTSDPVTRMKPMPEKLRIAFDAGVELGRLLEKEATRAARSKAQDDAGRTGEATVLALAGRSDGARGDAGREGSG